MRDVEGLWHSLLAGYESVRPLSGGERQLIPHFVLLRHIWVLASTSSRPCRIPRDGTGIPDGPEEMGQSLLRLCGRLPEEIQPD